jgi:tRNA threonylcarbamoyladenosine biosynthesis protein TsaE
MNFAALNEAEMAAVGAALAAVLRAGDVIGLSGDLGAGKTTLARGVLAALGLAGEAPSPSFAIVQPYAPPEVRLAVAHVDLYRLDDPDECAELALEDYAADGALIIEWPERLPVGAWSEALMLTISGSGDTRALTAAVPPAWEGRWPPQPFPQ